MDKVLEYLEANNIDVLRITATDVDDLIRSHDEIILA